MTPDSYVREHGRGAFEEYVANALPLSRYWIDELNKRHPATAPGRKAAPAAARGHLELVSAPMLRESSPKCWGATSTLPPRCCRQ